MDRFFLFLSTGLYSGYLPKAPGTWGSLVGVAFWWLLFSRLAVPAYLLGLVIILLLGVFSAGATEKILDLPDPGLVVIDEILGQLIVFIALPASLPVTLSTALCGFLLFRLFDIWKPFPVNWLDTHIHGGWGIMLDDVLAGVYALAIMQLGYEIIQRIH